MSYRNRPAPRDLPPEQRYNAAFGTMNIAKSQGSHLCPRIVPTQDCELSNPFRCSQNARRFYSFVRRDHHQICLALPMGGLGERIRSNGIVANRRNRIIFQKRNVLVSSRMVNHVRAIGFQYLRQQCDVADIPQYEFVGRTAIQGCQLGVDVVKAAFGMVEKYQSFRLAFDDSPAEGSADPTTGSRNQDASSEVQIAQGHA